MAHIAEETGLRAIDFGESLGSFALLVLGPGICNASRNLTCHKLKECPVTVVKRLSRTDRCE